MKGRSLIGESCSCGARLETQLVLDWGPGGPVLAGVDQHVRSDLCEGRFEKDQVVIVGAATGALAQQIDRVVKRVQAVFESGQRGVKLKRLGG
jgi:hypothetical protein